MRFFWGIYNHIKTFQYRYGCILTLGVLSYLLNDLLNIPGVLPDFLAKNVIKLTDIEMDVKEGLLKLEIEVNLPKQYDIIPGTSISKYLNHYIFHFFIFI